MRSRILPAFLTTVAATSAAVLAGAGQAGAEQARAAESPFTITHGTFGEYAEGRTATTYDAELVPEGAKAGVFSASRPWLGTVTKLGVTGLVPNRHYGAHAHAQPCGPEGSDAGPHFQYVQDPNPPSTDPAYANPDNEIWLDFTTNDSGNAVAASRVDWSFEDRRPASVVIHEHHTATEPGEAGGAGARLACINVNF